jgi:capsule polysaccharide export protein KpsE/RkpR
MATQTEPVQAPPVRERETALGRGAAPNWLYNIRILWHSRRLLMRFAAVCLVINLGLCLLIPKTYTSEARIMPPEGGGSSSALIAALAGRSMQGELLSGLAASLMSPRNSGALFIDLLRSTSVSNALIERFQLQHVYHKRYRVDAAKALGRRTEITQDKKSGVITLQVKDHDPRRARDLAQAYLDELNALVNRTSTSSAHQERVFIEKRIAAVKTQLERAQEALSAFSSTHSTVDLPDQTRATVESQAKVQGELIAAQSELSSLEQIYGDGNVRVRSAEAQVATLKRELDKMGGSAAPLPAPQQRAAGDSLVTASDPPASYLPLRQVPRLAVPYADLYRELHIQETVYDLLIQQYEVSRIEEAKDVPAVNIIDAPNIPEKKTFPPRAVLTLSLTAAMLLALSVFLILRDRWRAIHLEDPRRVFAREVAQAASDVIRRSAASTRRPA